MQVQVEGPTAIKVWLFAKSNQKITNKNLMCTMTGFPPGNLE